MYSRSNNSKVTNPFDDAGQDNFADVHPELRLPLEAALGIKQQVMGKTRPVLAEALIERIVAHGAEPVARPVDEVVEVRLVLVVVEAAALLAETVGLIVALGL